MGGATDFSVSLCVALLLPLCFSLCVSLRPCLSCMICHAGILNIYTMKGKTSADRLETRWELAGWLAGWLKHMSWSAAVCRLCLDLRWIVCHHHINFITHHCHIVALGITNCHSKTYLSARTWGSTSAPRLLLPPPPPPGSNNSLTRSEEMTWGMRYEVWGWLTGLLAYWECCEVVESE